MGFPTDMYPVLFVLPLLAGWLAHWVEGLADGITTAPSQAYRGRGTRQFVEMAERRENSFETDCVGTTTNRRREAKKDYESGK
jgi:citrate synthase